LTAVTVSLRFARSRLETRLEMPSENPADFVSIEGVVHLLTDLGVFLVVNGLRVFVAKQCMKPIYGRLAVGTIVVLQVARWYSMQEGFIE